MTITVTTPNGATVQFPDGTDHDTINGVMTQHFGSATPPPDKYQQAAQDDIARVKAAGGDEGAGYTRRLAHGATFGADSTLLAAAQTPLEMIRRGTLNPAEGYNYAKAREDQIMGDARKNTGALGTAAEILGGGVSGAGLAKQGVTTASLLAPEAGAVARTAASAADAGAIGGFSGAMEGNGLQERATNAVKGVAGGLLVGTALPIAGALVKGAAAPVISNIKARLDPKGFAESQVARGIHESGIDPNQISTDVIQAGNEGQGAFTVGDAMGNAGQRLLSTVARAPGEGRTAVVDALESRQADQGRRVSAALAEGFDSPQTAAQTEARLTGARDTAANREYGAVRNDAGPVDVTGAISHIDRTLGPAADQMLAHPGSVGANDGIEGVLQGFRNRLSRVNPDDFASVQRIRGEMADAAQNAAQNGNGNRARLIRGAVGELDSAMEAASPGHAAANRNFAQASRNIDAVDQGRTAATRGRSEDTIPAFQALPPEGQAAFRSGYVDPLIANTQGAAFGANKARPLINDAFQAESNAMAPGAPMMQRRLGREQTMFETRAQALGGSKTMDNINDHGAMGIDPHLAGAVTHVLSGNIGGAVSSVGRLMANGWNGNTPQVRAEVAKILLQRAPQMNPRALEMMVNQTVARIQKVQAITQSLGRGASSGLATAAPEQMQRR